MSSPLTDQILTQLSGAPLQQIAQRLGIEPAQASGAVATALPLLMGALGKNASQPQGAEALFGALQKDFAGGGDLGGLLGAVLGGRQERQTDGAGILGHVLGGNQSKAESALGQATGLGGDKAGDLLKILAPIVLGFLAKHTLQGTGGASDAGQLGAVLTREQQAIGAQGGGAGSLLSAVLDQDGDGKLGIGDLLKAGSGLLGGSKR